MHIHIPVHTLMRIHIQTSTHILCIHTYTWKHDTYEYTIHVHIDIQLYAYTNTHHTHTRIPIRMNINPIHSLHMGGCELWAWVYGGMHTWIHACIDRCTDSFYTPTLYSFLLSSYLFNLNIKISSCIILIFFSFSTDSNNVLFNYWTK